MTCVNMKIDRSALERAREGDDEMAAQLDGLGAYIQHFEFESGRSAQ